jgi:hypothetical protein
MKIVTTRGSSAASSTPSDAPISGSAGSMMSIDIAAIDINSAISAMNSRNGRGNRAAVASEVWVSGGCKCAYMDRIVRLAKNYPHHRESSCDVADRRMDIPGLSLPCGRHHCAQLENYVIPGSA